MIETIFFDLAIETNNTFQQKQISFSPINFEKNITQSIGAGDFAKKNDAPSLLCALFYLSISIFIRQNGKQPFIKLVTYDLISIY